MYLIIPTPIGKVPSYLSQVTQAGPTAGNEEVLELLILLVLLLMIRSQEALSRVPEAIIQWLQRLVRTLS